MTNKYAESVMSKKKLKPNSRMKRWKPITLEDIKVYAAVALYEGIVWKPYSTDILFSTPGLKFKLIDKFLHIVDNNELGDNYPNASKIQPLWDYFNKLYSKLYTPKHEIAIDESCGRVV